MCKWLTVKAPNSKRQCSYVPLSIQDLKTEFKGPTCLDTLLTSGILQHRTKESVVARDKICRFEWTEQSVFSYFWSRIDFAPPQFCQNLSVLQLLSDFTKRCWVWESDKQQCYPYVPLFTNKCIMASPLGVMITVSK